MKKWIVAVVILLVHSTVVAGRVAGEVEVLGLTVGSSDLHSAILGLGQPDAVYLAASGPDGTTLPDDDIILEYRREFELAGEREARILVACDDATYLVNGVSVEIRDDLGTVEELRAALERAYGERYMEFRRALVCDAGDVECAVSDCRAPDGDVPVWRFAERGLEVQVHREARRTSTWLMFGPSYATETVPECPGGS